MLCSFHDAGKLAGHEGRYSYVTHGLDEKHLKIENVTLRDDGLFECQMIHPSLGAYRTSALVTVLGKVITHIHFNNFSSVCWL